MAPNSATSDGVTPIEMTSKRHAKAAAPGQPRYVSTLDNNGIKIESVRSTMNASVSEMMDKTILKPRSSPSLEDIALEQAVEDIADLRTTTEAVVSDICKSLTFPARRNGTAQGGNSPWSISVLPKRGRCFQPICAPRPDRHIGYALGKYTKFSREESGVLSVPNMKEYFHLGSGNVLPFLITELKSDATKGTLTKAEHQVAGSGTVAVATMRRLYEKSRVTSTIIDSVVFSLAASATFVLLYVHWYDSAQDIHYMSRVKSFDMAEAEDLKACRHTLENIFDWGLGTRLTKIRESLSNLDKILSEDSETLGPSLYAVRLDDSNKRDSNAKQMGTKPSYAREASVPEWDTDSSDTEEFYDAVSSPTPRRFPSRPLPYSTSSESKVAPRNGIKIVEQASPTPESRKPARKSLSNIPHDTEQTPLRRSARRKSAPLRQAVSCG